MVVWEFAYGALVAGAELMSDVGGRNGFVEMKGEEIVGLVRSTGMKRCSRSTEEAKGYSCATDNTHGGGKKPLLRAASWGQIGPLPCTGLRKDIGRRKEGEGRRGGEIELREELKYLQ